MTEEARVAVVTGGSRGIGLAIARQLAEAGHQVAVTYNSSPPAAAEELGLLAVQCNVTDPESLDAAFATVEDQLGRIGILVANAGITKDNLVLRMTDDDFTQVIETNLIGTYRACKRAIKGMMKGRWGRIILISSVVGLGGQAGQANYAASKAGLIGLGRSFAKEFASRGITVNIVAPGPIDTDMLAALNEDQHAQIVDLVPLGRVGSTDEVAAAVTFLSSESAGFITGTVLPVDGGLSMG
ncbi:MAG: beta-ketoacyl-ACP reductase [Actinomycetota bacterium]